MKKIFKLSKDDKWLTGLCGAIGNYYNVDTMLIRILMLIGFCLYQPVGLIYLFVAWIAPDEE